MRRIRSVRYGKIPRMLASKKSIAEIIVDFWATVAFAVVIVVFYLIYTFGASARLQSITDQHNVIYGNYLAQVYLRMPVSVAGQQMTMAELLAIYDYNQRLKLDAEGTADEDIDELSEGDDPLGNAIISITDKFVADNFPEECYAFELYGDGFYYELYDHKCGIAFDFMNRMVTHESMQEVLRGADFPEGFVTYVPQVDPRKETIMLFSVYDIASFANIYEAKDG